MFRLIKRLIIFSIILNVIPMNILYSKSMTKINEDKNIKVVFEGKSAKLENTLLILNGNVFISLNDCYDITRSKKLKCNKNQIVIKYSKYSVKFNIGSRDAYKGKQHFIWNSNPIKYKNKIYIPLQSYTKTIDKKYVLDSKTKTVLICKNNVFNKVKMLMNKANYVISTCKRYKSYYTSNYTGDSHDTIWNQYSEIYNDKKYLHKEVVDKRNGKKYGAYSYYYFNDNGFTKIFRHSGKVNRKPYWMQESTNASYFRVNYVDPYSQCLYPFVQISDVLLAGLNIKYRKNEVVLEGDTRIDGDYDEPYKYDTQYKEHIRIVIDKISNTFKEVSEYQSETVKKKHRGDRNKIEKYLCKKVIKDINGDFKIKVPRDLKLYIKKAGKHYKDI